MSILANYYVSIGHDVYIIFIGRNPVVSFDIDKRVTLHFPKFQFNNQMRLISALRTMIFLRSKVFQLNPDTILSFGEVWNNIVLLSLYRTKYSVFVSDRSQPNKRIGRINEFLRRFLYPKAKGIIAQTSYSFENALNKKFNSNIKVIGNPVLGTFNYDYSVNQKIVLFVGRLLKTKNVESLIDIFAQIDDKSWKLVICGGNLKNENSIEKYKMQVKKLGLETNIVFTGEVQNTEEYYKKASIFVFPSSSEGFPNALAEAIVHGIPSVAFDCIAGPSDIVENDKTGYLVLNNDFMEFKKKLELLMKNSDLREQFHWNCEKMQFKFATESISREYLNFITN